MKTDIFLKFADREEAEEVLAQNDVVIEDGKIPDSAVIAGYQAAIDVLFGTGVIHSPTGEKFIADGIEMPVLAPAPGFHVNIRIMGDFFPEGLRDYAVDPEPINPKCVFA